MTSTSNRAKAVAVHRPGAPGGAVARRRLRRHRGVSRRAAVQPLYEALSSGLGCDAIDYRMSKRPEWR